MDDERTLTLAQEGRLCRCHKPTTERLLLTVDADVAVITLNRPDRLNAVNDQLVEGLLDALSEVDAGDCGAAAADGSGASVLRRP